MTTKDLEDWYRAEHAKNTKGLEDWYKHENRRKCFLLSFIRFCHSFGHSGFPKRRSGRWLLANACLLIFIIAGLAILLNIPELLTGDCKFVLKQEVRGESPLSAESFYAVCGLRGEMEGKINKATSVFDR